MSKILELMVSEDWDVTLNEYNTVEDYLKYCGEWCGIFVCEEGQVYHEYNFAERVEYFEGEDIFAECDDENAFATPSAWGFPATYVA